MEISEVTRQSPWQQIADVTSLLIEQMEIIGVEKSEKDVKLAMENALKPGTTARFFACYDKGQAVACCMLNIGSGIEAGGDYLWINEFHVKEKNRGQGYGQALLKHILQWASEEGYGYIAGVTQPDNDSTRKLFSGQGFRTVEAVWMDKSE